MSDVKSYFSMNTYVYIVCSGYMAPEYVVRGKLSEKADVYSFGVLVIEVITGKRNNSISQNSFSLLQKVFHFLTL